MLGLAIAAGIPIIHVTTTDLLNVEAVLRCLAPDKEVCEWHNTAKMPQCELVFTSKEEAPISAGLYESLREKQQVLVLVNVHEDSPFAFKAGELPVPEDLQRHIVSEVIPEKQIKAMLPSFKGLTLKQTREVLCMTGAAYGKIDARSIADMRAQMIGSLPGLERVDTSDLDIYLPAAPITEWISLNRPYFLDPSDARLIPRGVLLDGESGVGKTQGAKYIAKELGVPLYVLDLTSSLSKWRGESEQNLRRALNAIDQEAPAVLLIDEGEKQFDPEKDDGGTSRLLAQLLFWMQEHKSRVLTVITTNDITKLPRELYRAGRCDLVLTLPALTAEEALPLAELVFKSLNGVEKISNAVRNSLKAHVGFAMAGGKTRVSHAAVTLAAQTAYKKAKQAG